MYYIFALHTISLRLTAFHNKTNPQQSYMVTVLQIAKQDIPERQQPKTPKFYPPAPPECHAWPTPPIGIGGTGGPPS